MNNNQEPIFEIIEDENNDLEITLNFLSDREVYNFFCNSQEVKCNLEEDKKLKKRINGKIIKVLTEYEKQIDRSIKSKTPLNIDYTENILNFLASGFKNKLNNQLRNNILKHVTLKVKVNNK